MSGSAAAANGLPGSARRGPPDLMTVAKGLTAAAFRSARSPLPASREDRTRNVLRASPIAGTRSPAPPASRPSMPIAGKTDRAFAPVGAQMFAELQELAARHPVIGDVRGGQGLFAVAELVADRATRTPIAPWPAQSDAMKALLAAARDEGVSFGSRGNLLIFAPPLVIASPISMRHSPCSIACSLVSSPRPRSAPHEFSPDLRNHVQPAGGDARALRARARDDARPARRHASDVRRRQGRPAAATEERRARSTQIKIGRFPHASAQEVDAAIAAADLAFPAWREPASKRVA